jgi:hypothetical protein
VTIHGYAIVCRNDCIADVTGAFPDALKNDADWRYFQNELDTCAWTVVGSASHRATPNVKKRRRLILSRTAGGLIEQADGWWWNPAELAWNNVVDRLQLDGAKIGVPGGQVAFDLFLRIGFASFHLSRANGACIEGGRRVFARSGSADQTLKSHGLMPGAVQVMDAAADVTLTVYR